MRAERWPLRLSAHSVTRGESVIPLFLPLVKSALALDGTSRRASLQLALPMPPDHAHLMQSQHPTPAMQNQAGERSGSIQSSASPLNWNTHKDESCSAKTELSCLDEIASRSISSDKSSQGAASLQWQSSALSNTLHPEEGV